jgi:hypothetical protein
MASGTSKNTKGREKIMNAVPWKLASDPTARYQSFRFGVVAQMCTRAVGFYTPAYSDYIDLFYACVHKWKSETYFLSSIDDILNHEAISLIVKIGEPVISLILSEIKREPSVLCFVLDDIIGTVPYLNEDSGNIKAICEAWIAWGERNDY